MGRGGRGGRSAIRFGAAAHLQRQFAHMRQPEAKELCNSCQRQQPPDWLCQVCHGGTDVCHEQRHKRGQRAGALRAGGRAGMLCVRARDGRADTRAQPLRSLQHACLAHQHREEHASGSQHPPSITIEQHVCCSQSKPLPGRGRGCLKAALSARPALPPRRL